MVAAALGLTYLGVVLCYVASPKAEERLGNATQARRFPRAFRLTGGGLLVTALGLFAIALPATEGVLIGLSALILTASVVVIAAPLAPRLIPITAGLVLLAAAVAQGV